MTNIVHESELEVENSNSDMNEDNIEYEFLEETQDYNDEQGVESEDSIEEYLKRVSNNKENESGSVLNSDHEISAPISNFANQSTSSDLSYLETPKQKKTKSSVNSKDDDLFLVESSLKETPILSAKSNRNSKDTGFNDLLKTANEYFQVKKTTPISNPNVVNIQFINIGFLKLVDDLLETLNNKRAVEKKIIDLLYEENEKQG